MCEIISIPLSFELEGGERPDPVPVAALAEIVDLPARDVLRRHCPVLDSLGLGFRDWSRFDNSGIFSLAWRNGCQNVLLMSVVKGKIAPINKHPLVGLQQLRREVRQRRDRRKAWATEGAAQQRFLAAGAAASGRPYNTCGRSGMRLPISTSRSGRRRWRQPILHLAIEADKAHSCLVKPPVSKALATLPCSSLYASPHRA